MNNTNPLFLLDEGRVLTKFLEYNCSPSEIALITSKLSKSAGKDNVWRTSLRDALKKNRKRIRDVKVKDRGVLDMAASLMNINLV